MIFDRQALFSDAQDVNTDVNSTHMIDLGRVPYGMNRDIGKGGGIPILVQVVNDFGGVNGGVKVSAQISDTQDFSDAMTVWESPHVEVKKLKAGYVFVPESVQRGVNKRYLRLHYSVTGNLTGGKITAGVTMGNQSNG